jgi:molecular chaperone DnaJ
MMERDYYDVLGVQRSASPEDIKRAYRKLAMQHHPDRNPGSTEAEERFKEATQAYEVLGHAESRARYDRFGHAGVRGGARGTAFDFDLSDALNAFMRDFGGLEDLFGGPRRSRGRRGPLRGSDVQMRLRITLEEVATGAEKTIRAKLLQTCEVCAGKGSASGEPVDCPTCQGRGEVRQAQRSLFGQFVSVHPCPRCSGEGKIITDPCRACGGEGRVREDRRIKVKIPPGVDTGNYLTLRGEGNVGPRGGPVGDLLVIVEVEPHEVFERHGDDVLMELPISFPQAALGAELEVPTLRGTAALEIPPGAQPGDMIRMPGEGIPHLGEKGQGDQLVQVHVWVPTRLSADERQEIETLAQSKNFTPPAGEKGFWRKMRQAFTS